MKAVIISEDTTAIERFSIVLKNAGYEIIVYHWLMKALDNFEEISPHLILISTRDYPRHWKTFAEYIKSGNIKNEPQVILFTDTNFSEDELKKAECLGIRGTFSSYDVEGLDNLRAILNKKNDIYAGLDNQPSAEEYNLDDGVKDTAPQTNKAPLEQLSAESHDAEDVPSVATILEENTQTTESPVSIETSSADDPYLEAEAEQEAIQKQNIAAMQEASEQVQQSVSEIIEDNTQTTEQIDISSADDPYLEAEAEQEAIQKQNIAAMQEASEQVQQSVSEIIEDNTQTAEHPAPIETSSADDPYLEAEAEQEAIQKQNIAAMQEASEQVQQSVSEIIEDNTQTTEQIDISSADDPYLEAEAEQEAIQNEMLLSKAEKEFDAEMLTPEEMAHELTEFHYTTENVACYDFMFSIPETKRIITGVVQSCTFPSLQFIPDFMDEHIVVGEEFTLATLKKDEQLIPVTATVQEVGEIISFNLEKNGGQ
ncbi:MAG: hypothetical protein K6E51_02710 [Treponema sp.]|nr:hypothetical protein [Treponema sp.]